MSKCRSLTWTWFAVALLGIAVTGSAFAQAAPVEPSAAAAEPVAAPAEAAPAEVAPAAAAPVEAAPVEAAPAQEAAPLEQAAPADAAPAMTEEEAKEAAEEEENATKCLIRDVCLGPVLTLGLFNPLGIGIHARIADDWGVGFDYQFLPTVGPDTTNFSISLLTLNGRWYPGGGSFFLTAGFAYQMFDAKGTATVDEVDPVTGNMMSTPVTVTGSIGIPTFMLGLGVMGGSGFVMGIDLALEIPMGSADVDFDSALPAGSSAEVAAKYADLQGKISDAGDLVVSALPILFQVNLLRIGYLF